ncbi:hypothetical protein WJ969_19385 [Achromobacter xylosoxidans]
MGDLVDGGPESADLLKWLERQWFHAICGNHDLMTGRRTMCDPIPDVDHRVHGGGWLDARVDDVRGRVASCLSALPPAIEVETPSGVVGMVHTDSSMTIGKLFTALPSVRRTKMPAYGLRSLSNAVFLACPQCACGGPWTHMTMRRPAQLGTCTTSMQVDARMRKFRLNISNRK